MNKSKKDCNQDDPLKSPNEGDNAEIYEPLNSDVKKKLEELRDQCHELSILSGPSRMDKLFGPIALVLMMISIFAVVLGSREYVDKTQIKGRISTLIENDADLGIIKHVFNNKKIIKKIVFFSIFSKKGDSYPDNVALSSVLSDIKADLFLSGKPDNEELNKIDNLIESNDTQNPFDGLPDNQKDVFENIVVKSNSNYSNIQPDVNKLAKEIRAKNIQIEKNGTMGTVSYYITIISFITAIVIAAFQIFQNRQKKTVEIVVAAISEIEARSTNEISRYKKKGE